MRKITTAILILVVGMIHISMAQNNWVGIQSAQPVEADIRLVESTIETTRIQLSLEGYFENAVRTPRGTESIIYPDGGVLITEKGMPDLGKLYANIVIPDLYEMDIKIISSKYQEYSNIAVAPSKGHFTRDVKPEDVPFIYGDAYNEDAFWPGNLAQLEEPFIMRDFRGQTVTVFPFQYNPVSQTLRVYTDIVLEVTSTGEPGRDALVRKRDEISIEKDFGLIYNRFFLNMETAHKNYQVLEGEEGSLLIIAYDDFVDAMQPFVNWKRQTGRKTVIVPKSQAGANAAAIKSYVLNYYNENPDFAHLLLVGDGPQIPPVNASGGPSDNAYGFLVGNNNYNDIFVGRFSAETVAHVQTQVERMIQYEKDINESDTWLSKGMGIARNEGAGGGHNGGEADFVHMNFIRDTLLDYTYTEVLQRYDGNVPGVPNTNATQMSADFNNGIGIVNFCNHGSVTGWSVANYNISHVNQLTNVGKLPFIWSVACVNGNFVNNFCFAEAWMRATHNGDPSGAIGTMMSTINQLWQPPMTGQDEMVTLLAEMSTFPNVNTHQRTFGGLSINGSMSMIPAFGAGGISTHQTWILFGDPTLKVRTAAPTPFTITYNPVILIGANSFDLTIPGADGATVALSYYDEVEEEVIIVGTAVVNDGLATVDFNMPVTQPGSFTLTVMGFNKVTYINEEIQVIPPDGPYVVFDSLGIDDAAGNNNNQADYGETILLNVSLKNVGVENAFNVSATLSSESEYVVITQNQSAWGSIGEDDQEMVVGAFTFEINQQIPDNHTVLFSLEISGENVEEEAITWDSNFSLNIYSPVFAIGIFEVDDAETGNENGRLDPGETADIIVRFTNNGGAPAMAPAVSLDAENPYFTILESAIEPGVIPAGQFIDVAFPVQAHVSVMEGTMVDLLISVEDNHLVESEQLLIIGQVPEDQIGDGNTPSNQYPFYNYYKANRSQMIYTAEELGAGAKTIMEIGFDIIQASTQNNNLPNFVIRMMHVDQNAFGGSFINTANAEVVFQVSAYQMPETTGLHIWEILPFEYDGQSNLLVEVVWGILPQWTSTYYKVASTNVGANRVVYGFSDTQAVPGYNGASQVRPNLYLYFAADATEPAQEVTFQIKDAAGEPLENSWIELGSSTLQANEFGEANIELFPGTYTFDAYAEYLFPMTGLSFTVEDESLTVEVIFAQDGMYLLSLAVNPANSGVVTGGGIYVDGTLVDITALPTTGYEFVSWTDHNSTVISDQPDFQYTMPEHHVTLTAHFELITYTLSYLSENNGTLEGDTDQTVSHGHDGTPVTAIPDQGYHFLSWNDGTAENPRTDMNITDNLEVTAYFALNVYDLVITREGMGDIFVNDELFEDFLEVEHGATVSIVATPHDGWMFVDWSGDLDSDDSTLEFTMEAHMTLHAVFSEIPMYNLSLECVPNGGGTMQGDGAYQAGEEVEVTATPLDDFEFVNWEDADGNELSQETTYIFTMPAEDITLFARFYDPVSVHELKMEDIVVFPIPAKDYVKVQSAVTMHSLTVTDLQGRIIMELNADQQEVTINTTTLENGIYFLKIETSAGLGVKTFMVKR